MAGKVSGVLLRDFVKLRQIRCVETLEPITQWRNVMPFVSQRALNTFVGAEILIWCGNRAA